MMRSLARQSLSPYSISIQMQEANQHTVPYGFTQLTEGRIRTTDIILGESGRWTVPHVFMVGGDIRENGRRVARPAAAKKAGGRS
jgi:hypothetical protein